MIKLYKLTFDKIDYKLTIKNFELVENEKNLNYIKTNAVYEWGEYSYVSSDIKNLIRCARKIKQFWTMEAKLNLKTIRKMKIDIR